MTAEVAEEAEREGRFNYEEVFVSSLDRRVIESIFW